MGGTSFPGGGTPFLGLAGGYPPFRPGKGYPSVSRMGYPHPDWGRGTPLDLGRGIPCLGREYPTVSRMGYTPPPPSRPGKGYPPPHQQDKIPPCPDLGRGTPLPGPGKGVPPSRSDPRTGGYPQLEQHSMYLLRAGWYASSVYAGGLSCQIRFAPLRKCL